MSNSDDDTFGGLGAPEGQEMPDFAESQTFPDQSDLSGLVGSATQVESKDEEDSSTMPYTLEEYFQGALRYPCEGGGRTRAWIHGIQLKLHSGIPNDRAGLERDLPEGKTLDDLQAVVDEVMRMIDADDQEQDDGIDDEEHGSTASFGSDSQDAPRRESDPFAILKHFRGKEYLETGEWKEIEDEASARRSLVANLGLRR